MPQNSYNGNIEEHWLHITITNTILKKLEIFQDLPKCDTETWNEQMLLEKMAPVGLFNAQLPQTFNL